MHALAKCPCRQKRPRRHKQPHRQKQPRQQKRPRQWSETPMVPDNLDSADRGFTLATIYSKEIGECTEPYLYLSHTVSGKM